MRREKRQVNLYTNWSDFSPTKPIYANMIIFFSLICNECTESLLSLGCTIEVNNVNMCVWLGQN